MSRKRRRRIAAGIRRKARNLMRLQRSWQLGRQVMFDHESQKVIQRMNSVGPELRARYERVICDIMKGLMP